MFIHNINPVILSIGPLAVRWYSLVYVIGFLLAYWWLTRLAKQGAIENLTPEIAERFMVWLIVGVVVGGRFFEFVFYQTDVLLSDPLEILRIWHGGMSFHGGLIGTALVAWRFTRKYKLSLLQLGDALVIPAAFSLFIGRIANFINAELWGKATEGAPWYCIDYSQNQYVARPPAGCRHPSQLYESFKNMVIFGVLMSVWHYRKERPRGLLMWLFITLYGLFRFVVNFWRDDPAVLLGLSMGQTLSALMFFVGVGGVYWVTRRR